MSEERPYEPDRGHSTLVEERVEPSLDSGDHERFAHYARKEKIMESMVTGTPLIALCGKVWVPSRDPSKYPVCPQCKEILDRQFGPDDGDTDS